LAAVEIEFSQDNEFLVYLGGLMRDCGCDQRSSHGP